MTRKSMEHDGYKTEVIHQPEKKEENTRDDPCIYLKHEWLQSKSPRHDKNKEKS